MAQNPRDADSMKSNAEPANNLQEVQSHDPESLLGQRSTTDLVPPALSHPAAVQTQLDEHEVKELEEEEKCEEGHPPTTREDEFSISSVSDDSIPELGSEESSLIIDLLKKQDLNMDKTLEQKGHLEKLQLDSYRSEIMGTIVRILGDVLLVGSGVTSLFTLTPEILLSAMGLVMVVKGTSIGALKSHALKEANETLNKSIQELTQCEDTLKSCIEDLLKRQDLIVTGLSLDDVGSIAFTVRDLGNIPEDDSKIGWDMVVDALGLLVRIAPIAVDALVNTGVKTFVKAVNGLALVAVEQFTQVVAEGAAPASDIVGRLMVWFVVHRGLEWMVGIINEALKKTAFSVGAWCSPTLAKATIILNVGCIVWDVWNLVKTSRKICKGGSKSGDRLREKVEEIKRQHQYLRYVLTRNIEHQECGTQTGDAPEGSNPDSSGRPIQVSDNSMAPPKSCEADDGGGENDAEPVPSAENGSPFEFVSSVDPVQ